MNKKSKNLHIASIITYFLPLIMAAVYFALIVANGWTGYIPFFMIVLPMLPGLFLYFIVPAFKKGYYKKKDDPEERKYAIITTCIECGAPMIIEIILFIVVLNLFSGMPLLLLVRTIYILSFIPFLIINIAFWRSFPKEEKKEV
ncbi:MAG: hypothetical protein IKM80_05060 [Bacilli bacterium]|nr:hypothetical protein [Bacilli bacterium]